MLYIWLGAVILFAVLEAASLSLTSIWFAFGALIAMVGAALHLPVAAQIALFAAGSVLLLVLTRKLVSQYLRVGKEKTNVEAMIEKEGVVIETVDNMESVGQIKVGGQVWSAVSETGELLPRGTKIKIVEISGVKAKVRKI